MKRFMTGLVLVTIASLSYVFAGVQTFQIGYTIRKQEEMKVQLLDRARALKYNIAKLKSPANLEKRLLAQKVLLASPKTWQTLVLADQARTQSTSWTQSVLANPALWGKFLVGTAEAQAKES